MSDLLDADPAIKTEELKGLMRQRFCAPEWALFFEVFASTGYAAGGRADAVAMNLYPSRGLTVNGFEMKASRADWLRELKEGAKAETIFRYCDHWWLVVGDRSIVKANELPEPWGLIAPRRKEAGIELAIIKQAPTLKPQALDKSFIAVLARRAQTALTEELQPTIDAAVQKVRAELQADRKRDQEYATRQHRELKEQVDAFEKASGVRITSYGGEEIGEAVAVVRRGGMTQYADTFRWMVEHAERLNAELQALKPLIEASARVRGTAE